MTDYSGTIGRTIEFKHKEGVRLGEVLGYSMSGPVAVFLVAMMNGENIMPRVYVSENDMIGVVRR